MKNKNYQLDGRKELDEESFLRSLGIDDFDIEMILNSRREASEKYNKKY